MSNHPNHFPDDLIEDAFNHAWDSRRSHSQNISHMTDYLGQFTGALSRDQQITLEIDLNDEISRHKSFNPFDFGG
jgi:hypothetical protein